MSKLDELADKALGLKIQLDEITELYKEATADFIEQAKAEGKYDTSLKVAGNARIKLQQNRFFDLTEAEKLVTKKMIAESTVKVVDAKLLKQKMTPEQVNPDDEARLEKALEQSANGQVVSRGSFAQYAQTPLNPDALEAAYEASRSHEPSYRAKLITVEELAKRITRAYLTAAQPEGWEQQAKNFMRVIDRLTAENEALKASKQRAGSDAGWAANMDRQGGA